MANHFPRQAFPRPAQTSTEPPSGRSRSARVALRLLAATVVSSTLLAGGLSAQAAPNTPAPRSGSGPVTVPPTDRPAIEQVPIAQTAANRTSDQRTGTPTPTPSTNPGARTPASPTQSSAPSQSPTPAGQRSTAQEQSPAGKVTAELPARASGGFSMVGVTWAPGTRGVPTIEVKVQRDGAWGEWEALPAQDLPDDPARSNRPGTAPTFVGQATGLQVRAITPAGVEAPQDLKALLIDPHRLSSDESPSTDTRLLARSVPARSGEVAQSTLDQQREALERGVVAQRADGGQPPMPAIVSRAGWGADESLKTSCDTTYSSTIRGVVVHHTEGTNNYTKAESAGIVRGIYAYHVQGNHWCDIGYNFLIDKYGQIFEGRSGGITMPVKGAHAVNWNTDTMGISLMGDFTSVMPTATQIDAAVRLSAWRLAAYYRTPTGRITINGQTSDVISGHRQVVQTDCPGDTFYAYMATFRSRVAQTMGSFNTAIKQRWDQLGGASGPAGQPVVGETPVNGGRVTRFANYDISSADGVPTSFVRGVIREKYRSIGAQNSFLGFARSDEICPGTGCFNAFAGDQYLLWSAATGAHPSVGALRQRYAGFDFEHGWLGYPTTDEDCEARGCSQRYQGGSLWFDRSSGSTWFLRGIIEEKYRSMGAATSYLGFPRTDEMCSASGCRQDFASGDSILWSGRTGAHFVNGAIRQAYLGIGGPGSRLGYPTTDEICTASGCRQSFTGGQITWSPSTGAVIR